MINIIRQFLPGPLRGDKGVQSTQARAPLEGALLSNAKNMKIINVN